MANSTAAPSDVAFSRATASASRETSVATTRAPARPSASDTAMQPEPVQRSSALPRSGSAASADLDEQLRLGARHEHAGVDPERPSEELAACPTRYAVGSPSARRRTSSR